MLLLVRPSRALLVACGFGILGGAVAAHRAATPPPDLSISRAKAVALTQTPRLSPEKGPPAAAPRYDLRRARVVGDRLRERLPDGRTVEYTVDPDLDAKMRHYFAANALPYAAAVMIDLDDGAVKLLAGHSSRKPELDDATLCLTPWAPAASVFKLVTAAALLERGVPPETTVCYHGGLGGLEQHHLIDNPRRDTRCETFSRALAKSINPVFGKLALRYLDQRSLSRWARRFAFNQEVPFDLPLSPSAARIPRNELPFARVAAGFWETEISALHGALIASAIAKDGVLHAPHIVEAIRGVGDRRSPPQDPRKRGRVLARVMRPEAARALREMMIGTTTSGSARRGFFDARGRALLPGVTVAAKTGTLSRNKPFVNYSWLVGFAPANAPRYAIAVVLGNPARWRIKAADAARTLLSLAFAKSARDGG